MNFIELIKLAFNLKDIAVIKNNRGKFILDEIFEKEIGC